MSLKNATVQPRVVHKPPFSLEVPGCEPVQGETIPRRNVNTVNKLVEIPAPGVRTTFDIVKFSAEKYGNAKALGSRKLIKTHQETRKVKKVIDGEEQEVDKNWTYFELSGYHYLSFKEYEKLTLQIGSGLRQLGLLKDDRVHIYAATSAHWLAVAHGAASQSMPIVTAYDTLGEAGLTHSLVATGSKIIFLDPHLLTSLIKPITEAKELKYVIWNSDHDVKPEHTEQLKKAHDHLIIKSFEELRELGEANPMEPVPPQPEDLCCIMYTSGSTGTPKGVALKHKNVLAAIAGVSVVVEPYIGPGDSLLAYLPLAHIFEFVFEHSCLFWGGTMGYGNPKTLSDTSVRHCKGDIRELRPSILIGVPAVWESVKKGIITKVNASSVIARNLFWAALWAKNNMLQLGIPGVGILDSVVFKKIKEATGGRLRVCMNGGGPISKETQRFISMSITPMIIGYGLTETCAIGVVMDPFEWTDRTIGTIAGCDEIKLVDFPDAGYFATNKPNPQGEIWIRGASVMDGYYQNESLTAEALTSDGWFKTGDIGEWDRNGHLNIIDRKKNLVKTLNGEYIALEKLESVYCSAALVGNICVYADEQKTKPVAIIVPLEPALKKLANSIGVDGHGVEQLVHNKQVQGAVHKELLRVGRAAGLVGVELLDGVVLADEEWTPANGLVTAAQKLNRRLILQKHQKAVDEAYARNN